MATIAPPHLTAPTGARSLRNLLLVVALVASACHSGGEQEKAQQSPLPAAEGLLVEPGAAVECRSDLLYERLATLQGYAAFIRRPDVTAETARCVLQHWPHPEDEGPGASAMPSHGVLDNHLWALLALDPETTVSVLATREDVLRAWLLRLPTAVLTGPNLDACRSDLDRMKAVLAATPTLAASPAGRAVRARIASATCTFAED